MKRSIRWIILVAALVSLLALTGCTLGSSVESLFTLPQLPEEYRGLSETLETMLDEGYIYLTPTVGPNIEPVQMVDLDADGTKEAVVLMQHNGDSAPLKVMVFHQSGGSFERLCTVEKQGVGIDSIDYRDLTGDGVSELLIGWRNERDKQRISVHLAEHEALPLMESGYEEYLVQDMTGDGTPGLVLISTDFRGTPIAKYYAWETDILRQLYACGISSETEELSRGSMVGGYLDGGIPAVFLTAVREGNMATTEILACKDGEFVSIAPQNESRYYCQLDPQDIDGDGITEVPYPLQSTDSTAAAKDTVVQWRRYDAFGTWRKVSETYHCQSYGWYITWPEEYWNGITVSNGDIITGENCAELFLRGKPVAAVYSITCENRESRAQMGDRFIVMRLPGTIYSAEIYGETAADGASITALRDSFSLIVNTWDLSGKE